MAGFSIPIQQLAEKAELDVETVVRKVTLDLFADVVRRSPVDTGRFKGNWNVSFGTPDYTTSVDAKAGRADGEVAKALTLAVGGTQYLTNGLAYAQRLEHGWSGQAPQGMVRLSAQRMSDHVEKALE